MLALFKRFLLYINVSFGAFCLGIIDNHVDFLNDIANSTHFEEVVASSDIISVDFFIVVDSLTKRCSDDVEIDVVVQFIWLGIFCHLHEPCVLSVPLPAVDSQNCVEFLTLFFSSTTNVLST